jgi:predicted kinase
MKTPTNALDADALAMAEFKEEGAFLLRADCAAEVLAKRLKEAAPDAKVVTLSRDELAKLSQQFTRAVDIAKDYHIGAAEAA